MSKHEDFRSDLSKLQACGIIPMAADWTPEALKRNFTATKAAMDAQPTLQTNPNAGVPAWIGAYIDPEVVRVLQTPNMGAQIVGERKSGDWTSTISYFPMIENVGEVSAYGDYNENGVSEVNAQWESRQPFLFQTNMTIGDLEVERAVLGNINLVSEKQISCAKNLDKFSDYTYHFGVTGLANYGLLNDPSLPPALTPTPKAAGGNKWVTNGAVTAGAQEIYSDFLMMYNQMSANGPGYITPDTQFVFVYPNQVAGALGATNQFGITVRKYISETFPNVQFVANPRYNTVAGNIVQLIAKTYDGNESAYCAFNVKLKDHSIERKTSSYYQKKTSGSYGAVIRYPLAFVSMLGI